MNVTVAHLICRRKTRMTKRAVIKRKEKFTCRPSEMRTLRESASAALKKERKKNERKQLRVFGNIRIEIKDTYFISSAPSMHKIQCVFDKHPCESTITYYPLCLRMFCEKPVERFSIMNCVLKKHSTRNFYRDSTRQLRLRLTFIVIIL